jgi:SAM-dependent methyltransferase
MTGTAALVTYRLRRALRRYGLLGTVRNAVRQLVSIPARRRDLRREREFDARYAIDTAGVVQLRSLEIESANRDFGVRYEATNPDWFRELVGALPIDYREFVFVDFGAGKGRALALASEFPFRRIVGVEFSPELADVARRNMASFRSDSQQCRELEVVCCDAVDFELPGDPAVLYFYNPFGEPVLSRVLANIRSSFDASPRPLYVVVTGDAPLRAVEEAGFVALDVGSDADRGRRVFAARP